MSINKRSKVEMGDILFGMIGTIGNPVIVDRDNFAIKNVALIKQGGKIPNSFLIQLLKSPAFIKYIRYENTGNTQKFLSLSKVRELNFFAPNYKEQQIIGTFFKSMDDVIALHQEKLAKLQSLKKAALQSLFPKKDETEPKVRFANFSSSWKQRKIFDIAEKTFGGGTPKTSIKEHWNGELPWIQSSDLNLDKLNNVNPTKYITNKAIKDSSAKIVPKNSIAIVTRVGVGKLAFMPYSYSTSQDILSLSLLKVDSEFGVYSLYKILKKELNNLQGTSIKGITKKDLLEKPIMIPTSSNEQYQLGEFLQYLDKIITLYQQKLEKLQNFKKAFLQKMFI